MEREESKTVFVQYFPHSQQQLELRVLPVVIYSFAGYLHFVKYKLATIHGNSSVWE